jgi:hypothetical protein
MVRQIVVSVLAGSRHALDHHHRHLPPRPITGSPVDVILPLKRDGRAAGGRPSRDSASDRPLAHQYALYLSRIVQGDLGRS